MIWLLIYVCAISLYDMHTRRIPNWYTLPSFVAGMLVNFSVHPDIWLASFRLARAWTGDGWEQATSNFGSIHNCSMLKLSPSTSDVLISL
jgi:hypothetical protein